MKKIILSIDGMTCSACSNGLEKYLNKQNGIYNASVNLVMANATIDYDEKILNQEKLDEFVRNGGNLKDYFQLDADIDLDNVVIEDNEVNQKAVVRMLLKEKGFSSSRIDKMINKYEDAGILEDEA